MRTIEEIKAKIQEEDEASGGASPILTVRWLELYGAIADGVPLSRLEAICNAERDGLCVVLPCKINDWVWFVDCTMMDCDECENLENGKNCKWIDKPICPKGQIRKVLFRHDMIPAFSKTIFLTEVAAEAALGHAHD